MAQDTELAKLANYISVNLLTNTVSFGAAGQIIPSGTTMTFQQTAAPTGFTKVTTYNDYAMRIVNGSVANKTNGVAFTTAFASQSVAGTVGDTTLTTTQIPAHNHGISDPTHAHSIADPGHSHSVGNVYTNLVGGNSPYFSPSSAGFATLGTTGSGTGIGIYGNGTGITVSNAGGGGSHNHTFTGTAINMAVNYLDFILASAN